MAESPSRTKINVIIRPSASRTSRQNFGFFGVI